MRAPLYNEGQRVKWIGGDLLGTITFVGDHRRFGGGVLYDVKWDDGRTSTEITENFHYTETLALNRKAGPDEDV